VHLERALFRTEPLPPSADADGVETIEAPGLLGEARLLARAIKTLLLGGTRADDIIVTARDLGAYVDVVCEVFAEYGIPADIEGVVPLIRNPAVATLLRAVRLADEDFPFAATTSLLRSTYFRPPWSEFEADGDVATHAEILLRLLGEPQGKEAYLLAARLWASEPQPGLEDEDAEEPHRRRKHDLAKRCLPFLERFFHAWDALPERSGLAEFADRLRAFAADIGLDREAERTDAAAWSRFWAELDALRNGSVGHRPSAPMIDLLRLVATVAASVGVARSASGPGQVRMLPAEQARHLDCDNLFLLGLGERGFPDLGGGPLFDEAERDALRAAGLPVRCAADRLPDEMLLFFQIVTRPRRRLVLSYPAVDDKGQSLLPSSFLTACRECFADGAIPVTRQRMLIEGYDRLRPLSPAEFRVRWAADGNPTFDASEASTLAADLVDHLDDARAMAGERFRSPAFSPYDGLLRSPGVIADLRERFGPDKVLSPTALEHYVACPFRFFLEVVLKLDPLDDPAEEVEHTRRGAAVHRALARLHRRLDAEGVHAPSSELTEQYVRELRAAVEEYAARVSSPAAKALWRLEGRRLERAAARYPSHWSKFQQPWQQQKLAVRPFRFEVDFGLGRRADEGAPLGPLVIRHLDIEVRIAGRIDRIDVVELDDGAIGFWVIDYKTGRSGYYTGTDLASLKKLQLPLYALAVEALLLPDGRPLGLAYWMVTDAGAKSVFPRRSTAWLSSGDEWPRFRDHLERWVTKLAGLIRSGEFPLKPRAADCTSTCPYGEMCRIAEARAVEKTWDLPLPVLAAGGRDD
jgi:ATP-dependent helicase/DNAse subunit B